MAKPQSINVVRVWDLPTRLFHWLLAASILGSFISVKIGGNAMLWHGRFGYAVLTLLLFRLAWGVWGPVHSRFTQFVKGPAAVAAYLKKPAAATVGHNPLGALSVVVLIGLFLAQAVAGLFTTDDIFYEGPLVKHVSSAVVSIASSFHQTTEWYLIAMVTLHMCAIAYYGLVRKQNLITPMIVGDQPMPPASQAPASRDDASTRAKAAIVFAVCATLVGLIAYA
jgi:cytochrome b